MKVIAPDFAKIGGQAYRDGQWIPEFRFRIINRLKKLGTRHAPTENQVQTNNKGPHGWSQFKKCKGAEIPNKESGTSIKLITKN
ncbi:MAG: hypothetical protein Q8926_06070 [Bacteroidota bacterium]|nr:hypothetical protein [Bacteroidota bacterium]